jgi:hypothetical protein
LLLQLLAHATLLSARCCLAASALSLLCWMLFAGPLHWRIAVGYSFPKAAAAVYESTVFGGMLLRDLVSLWLIPAALALSAVAVRILQPLVQQQRPGALAGRASGGGQWMARLLPPRCVCSCETLDWTACHPGTVYYFVCSCSRQDLAAFKSDEQVQQQQQQQ